MTVPEPFSYLVVCPSGKFMETVLAFRALGVPVMLGNAAVARPGTPIPEHHEKLVRLEWREDGNYTVPETVR